MEKKSLRSTAKIFLLSWCLAVLQVRGSQTILHDTINPVREIGSRLELFVDDYLVDEIKGKATLRLHHPAPREVVLEHDSPWEGSGSGYHSIFKDGNIYRMYYYGWQLSVTAKGLTTSEHPFYTCYAESTDGIHWKKPNLGLHSFRGSKNNNIVIVPGIADPSHVAVFKDSNPHATPDAKYKAFLIGDGIIPFKSADGFNWTPITKKPVITDGAFDSQNLAFWDSVNNEYRAYWRYFTRGTTPMPYNEKTWKPEGVRAIRTAVSKDFVHWTSQADLKYVNSPDEELYTNQIKPYYRAPHILMGFPSRYVERGWSESMKMLPDSLHRVWRSKVTNRYGMAITEGLFMAGRDGVTFKRWNEGFLRPGIERSGTWAYGNQYIGWGMIETKSDLPGAPNELSIFATESYWTGKSDVLRRYTLRIDGFVSLNAPFEGGELITKPVRFEGSNLYLNFSTSAVGEIKVEFLNEDGSVVPGFAADSCNVVFGDTVERAVTWKNATSVASLAGKVVRLRFVLKDADIYSFRFR